MNDYIAELRSLQSEGREDRRQELTWSWQS